MEDRSPLASDRRGGPDGAKLRAARAESGYDRTRLPGVRGGRVEPAAAEVSILRHGVSP